MATLNVLVIDERPNDTPMQEALSVLQWAAEAGPFTLQIQRATDTSVAALPYAEAILVREGPSLDPGLLAGQQVFAQQHRIRLDPELVEASPLRPGLRSAMDVMLLQPIDLEPTPQAIEQVVRAATELAARRGGLITLITRQAALDSREQALHDALRASAERGGQTVQPCPCDQFTHRLLNRPNELDVLVALPELGPILANQAQALAGPSSSTPTSWLGRQSNIYQPRIIDAGAPHPAEHRLCATLLAVAELLEHSAARFFLAQSLRKNVAQVYRPTATKTGAQTPFPAEWHVGQAILERLEADFPLCASY